MPQTVSLTQFYLQYSFGTCLPVSVRLPDCCAEATFYAEKHICSLWLIPRGKRGRVKGGKRRRRQVNKSPPGKKKKECGRRRRKGGGEGAHDIYSPLWISLPPRNNCLHFCAATDAESKVGIARCSTITAVAQIPHCVPKEEKPFCCRLPPFSNPI